MCWVWLIHTMANICIKLTRMVSSRHQVEYVAFSPTGNYLAACLSDGSVRLYSVDNSKDFTVIKPAYSFKEHTSNVWCISFATDGKYLSSSSSDHRVIVYSLKTFSIYRIFTHHHNTVWCCKFCKMSGTQLLATASEDCTVQLLSVNNDEVHCMLHLFEAPVEYLDYNEDREVLSTASRDGKICLWANITSVPLCHVIYSGSNTMRLCQFINYDDKNTFLVTSSSSNHSILVLSIPDIQQMCHNTTDSTDYLKYQLDGHCNIVWSCCMVSPNNVLATCSGDRTIRFWDMNTGCCLHTLRNIDKDLGPNSQILSCDFCNYPLQGKSVLALGTYDGCLYIANINMLS